MISLSSIDGIFKRIFKEERKFSIFHLLGFAVSLGPSPSLFGDSCSFGPCWLVSQCLQYAHPDFLSWDEGAGSPGSRERFRQAAPVRVQALATLRQMLSHYLRFLLPSLVPLRHTLRLCLAESGDNDQMMLRTQAIKLLTSLLAAMREHDEEEWLLLWREFIDQLVAALQVRRFCHRVTLLFYQ